MSKDVELKKDVPADEQAKKKKLSDVASGVDGDTKVIGWQISAGAKGGSGKSKDWKQAVAEILSDITLEVVTAVDGADPDSRIVLSRASKSC